MPVGDPERLHHLPDGEVGDTGVADIAGAQEHVEGVQQLLDGRARIIGVAVEQIDMIGAEPFQRGIDRLDRKSVGWGKSVAVRVDLGGRRIIKKKKKKRREYNKG